MQRSAHESPGVDTVADFGDGAQRSGESKVLRDDRCEFDRCRCDEPHALTCVEMPLSEGQGARDEFVGHLLGEDALTEVHELIHSTVLDE